MKKKNKEQVLNGSLELVGQGSPPSPWADLPEHLLLHISNRHIGSLRLHSVCTAWRSTISPKPRFPPRPLHRSIGPRYLSKRTVFALSPPSPHSPPGSSHSPATWIIKLEDQACPGKMSLCSPLTGEYVPEPLPSVFPRNINLLEFDVVELGHEYVFWSYDVSLDLAVESVHGDKLAACFVGKDDVEFLVLAIDFPGRHLSMYRFTYGGGVHQRVACHETLCFADLITFQETFYAIDSHGTTHVIRPQSIEVTNTVASKVEMCGETKRLLECDGDLLLVDICTRRACCGSDQKIRIKLFKLDRDREIWVESSSLGDQVVFLGEKSSFLTPSSMSGCRGNRIVFEWVAAAAAMESGVREEEDVFGFGFIKVFDVESGKVEDFTVVPELMSLFWPPPSWISMHDCGPNYN